MVTQLRGIFCKIQTTCGSGDFKIVSYFDILLVIMIEISEQFFVQNPKNIGDMAH